MRADWMQDVTKRLGVNTVGLCAALLLSGLLRSSHIIAVAPRSDCGKWSLKDMSLSMTMGDFKHAHPKAKKTVNYYRSDGSGKEWYAWAEDRMNGLWNLVLPERGEDDSVMVSLMATIDLSGTSPGRALDALGERWGAPIRRGERPRIVGNEIKRTVTVWQDEECGVRATAIHRRVFAPLLNVTNDQVVVFIDRLTWIRAREQSQREEAREATSP